MKYARDPTSVCLNGATSAPDWMRSLTRGWRPSATYDLALVAETDVGAVSILIGEARHAFTPDRLECEFALSVADDWRGRGIGTLLTAEMECRARSLGARRLTAEILRANEPMKALALKTGFSMADVPRDARLVRIVKELAPSQMDRPGTTAGAPDLPLAA